MGTSELEDWLRLSLIPGISHKDILFLLNFFGEPGHIFGKSGEEKLSAKKHSPPSADQQNADNRKFSGREFEALLSTCRTHYRDRSVRERVRQALRWQEKDHQQIITLNCDAYPALLKEIPDPPPLLYIKGLPKVLCRPQIAMVGSRHASPGGKAIARQLARELAGSGFSVCSGMALGIDAESHLGALDKQGSSVAILGCGVDQVYPGQHKKLAERLAETGAVLSEFPLGSAPESWHFPQRNRVISGLSLGVVVVEAALRSGSLITARFALEQGREVFAVPGSLHNPQAKGCHLLLKQGATLVEHTDDIIAELGGFISTDGLHQDKAVRSTKHLNKDAKELLRYIDYETTSVDKLICQTGLETECIVGLLIELELQGFITSRVGGYSLSPTGA